MLRKLTERDVADVRRMFPEMTITELARAIGVNTGTVHDVLTGKVGHPAIVDHADPRCWRCGADEPRPGNVNRPPLERCVRPAGHEPPCAFPFQLNNVLKEV